MSLCETLSDSAKRQDDFYTNLPMHSTLPTILLCNCMNQTQHSMFICISLTHQSRISERVDPFEIYVFVDAALGPLMTGSPDGPGPFRRAKQRKRVSVKPGLRHLGTGRRLLLADTGHALVVDTGSRGVSPTPTAAAPSAPCPNTRTQVQHSYLRGVNGHGEPYLAGECLRLPLLPPPSPPCSNTTTVEH